MIHMYVGKEIFRDTKTACKVRLDELPRTDASVPFSQNRAVTCLECLVVVERTKAMRGMK